jgi:hypothetical protein
MFMDSFFKTLKLILDAHPELAESEISLMYEDGRIVHWDNNVDEIDIFTIISVKRRVKFTPKALMEAAATLPGHRQVVELEGPTWTSNGANDTLQVVSVTMVTCPNSDYTGLENYIKITLSNKRI